jgi:adenylate kinase family enzyme
MRVRIETYAHSATPLVDYYQNLGRIVHIEATGSPQAIFQHTLDALDFAPSVSGLTPNPQM